MFDGVMVKVLTSYSYLQWLNPRKAMKLYNFKTNYYLIKMSLLQIKSIYNEKFVTLCNFMNVYLQCLYLVMFM